MKKICLLVFLFFPVFLFSQEKQPFNTEDAVFFLDTKIMEDGTITNIGFGLDYSGSWGSEIRGRFSKTSKNEELDDPDINDSLIATNETILEMFFLPIQYRFAIRNNLRLWLGAGLYYEYQKSTEKGFIDMPILESIGMERVNSIKDDFLMNLFGPLFDIKLNNSSEIFNIDFSGGIVPVFFLIANEKYSMFPLIPEPVDHSQTTAGSPYFYLGLNCVLFKYANFAVLYNYAKLKYQVIDFDDNLTPIHPDKTVVTQSLMFEISALIPVGDLGFQIGYGHMKNFYSYDSSDSVSNNNHYLILSGKKISRK